MSSKNVKGHMHRKVQAPGYHLSPKYDLKGLREFLDAKKARNDVPKLPLTSMIDIMSILVIFLLMNFSATGELFFITKDKIKIPEASHARPIESQALISIMEDRVYFDAERIGDESVQLEETDQSLPRLRMRLQQMRALQETIRPGEPFKGQVNVQADQNLPVDNIKRVMTILISEGWTGINFAVTDSAMARKPSQE